MILLFSGCKKKNKKIKYLKYPQQDGLTYFVVSLNKILIVDDNEKRNEKIDIKSYQIICIVWKSNGLIWIFLSLIIIIIIIYEYYEYLWHSTIINHDQFFLYMYVTLNGKIAWYMATRLDIVKIRNDP